jgi:WD40 repeat protein
MVDTLKLNVVPDVLASLEPIPPVSRPHILKGTSIGAPSSELGDIAFRRNVEFRILGELGQGGMGVVYRAEQVYPRRTVALKVIKGAIAGTQAQKRFEREIEIMGLLSHRGIAQLYFAGMLDESAGGSSPFMAMEFVQGTDVITFAKLHALSTVDRLNLFIKICDIVAYAHRKGVIHRDLKPSNILVDLQGEPKVLDFGLAGAVAERHFDAGSLTLPGQVVGTFDYMSPEQAMGHLEQVDERSDVFALGILLYELLCHHLPFDVSGKTLVDAVRIIKESEPRRLSRFDEGFRGDLDTIVDKALCKERAERYSSIDALASDIRRFLAHEPIQARPQSLVYRANRFVRRNRLLVGSVLAIIVALTAGLGVAIDQAMRANALSIQFKNEAERARELAALATQEKNKKELLLADSRARESDANLQGEEFSGLWQDYQDAWDQYQALRVEPWKARLGIWQLNRVCAIPLREFDSGIDQLCCASFSGDQRLIARGFASGLVEIRDVISNERKFETRLLSNVSTLGFSPDGRYLLATSYNLMEIWRVKDHVRIRSIPRDSAGRFAQLGDDRIAYPTHDGILHIESFEGDELVSPVRIPELSIRDLRFAQGSLFLISQKWHVLQLAPNQAAFSELGTLQAADNDEASFSPDARHVALAHKNELVVLLSATCEPITHVARGVGHFGFAGNDAVFATAGSERPLEVFNFSGQRFRVVPSSGYMSAIMSPDLALTYSSSARSTLWCLHEPPQIRSLQQEPGTVTGAISDDGWIVALANGDGKVVLKDTWASRTLRVLDIGARPMSVAFSKDVQWLGVGTETSVQIWNLLKNAVAYQLEFPRVTNFALSAKGDTAVMYLPFSSTILLLRHKNDRWQKQEVSIEGSVHAIRIASDSSCFVVVDDQNRSQLWRISQSGELLAPTSGAMAQATTNALGELALTHSTSQNKVALWDLTAGLQVGTLADFSGRIYDEDVCEAGIGVVVDSMFTHLFDLKRNQLLCRLQVPIKNPKHVRLNANGYKLLITSQQEGSLLIDFTIPGTLRGLPEKDATSDSLREARWFQSAGLADQALPFYLENASRVDNYPNITDGFAFWDANNREVANRIFQKSGEMSLGAKALLAARLSIQRQNQKLP